MKLSSEHFDRIIRSLLYLLVFWLPYSPAVIETSVILGLLVWIAKVIIFRKSYTFEKMLSPFTSLIFFFLFLAILSSVGSMFSQRAIIGFFTKTAEWFVIYFLIVETIYQKRHILIIVSIFIVTATATSLDAIVQYFFTSKDFFLGHEIEKYSRATAAFRTANDLGAYLVAVIPLGAFLFWSKIKEIKIAVVLLIINILMVLALILTYSRGAWLGLAIGITLVFMMIVTRKTNNSNLRQKWVIVITCVLILTLIIGAILMFVQRPDTGWRLKIWNEASIMIKEKPLLGHGINTFMHLFQYYRTDNEGPTYAHNCFIQLTSEMGVIGLAVFLLIFVRLFLQVYRKMRLKIYNDQPLMLLLLGLLAGTIAYLVHSFFDTNLYGLQLGVLLWVFVGIQVSILRLL